MGITGGFKKLHGDTVGYKWLGYGGYKVLQEVIRGCKGLQEITRGVTNGYKR